MDNASINAWVNWAIYAIVGRMHDADALMRQRGLAIRTVADELQRQLPIEHKPLYRGMLLDPNAPLATDPAYTFVSWSEDYEVARWFGSRESYVSELLAEAKPHLRGFVMMLPAPTVRVLFHYTWANAIGMPLAKFAAVHPLLGREGARQIDWSLRTQNEVILEPFAELPVASPVEAYEGAPVAELDRRFSPPWTISAVRWS